MSNNNWEPQQPFYSRTRRRATQPGNNKRTRSLRLLGCAMVLLYVSKNKYSCLAFSTFTAARRTVGGVSHSSKRRTTATTAVGIQTTNHHYKKQSESAAEIVELWMMSGSNGNCAASRMPTVRMAVAAVEESPVVVLLSSVTNEENEQPDKEQPGASSRNNPADETLDADEDDHEDGDNDGIAARRRQAAKRAAFLLGRPGASTNNNKSKPKQFSSVGARRVKSATKAKQNSSASSLLGDAIRKTAQGTAIKQSDNKEHPNNHRNAFMSHEHRLKFSRAIHSTVNDMLRARQTPPPTPNNDSTVQMKTAFSSLMDILPTAAAASTFRRNPRTGSSIGILGEVATDEDDTNVDDAESCSLSSTPLFYPGATILGDETSPVQIRVATPLDDVPIASLRLSVFTHFTAAQQGQFCSRSCQAIAGRRLRGAVCLVAAARPSAAASHYKNMKKADKSSVSSSSSSWSLPHQRHHPLIVGSAECSFHEFFDTRLGQLRPQFFILYITEVAVNPAARRQGIGRQLLQAMDVYATKNQVETLYLHVDVTNHGAIQLYQQAGYRRVDDSGEQDDSTAAASRGICFYEFSKSLNLHAGATTGRRHYLLCKDLTPNPTWLTECNNAEVGNDDNGRLATPRTRKYTTGRNKVNLVGTFGFEIPA